MWFWVIKILCTTVGESFADWINMSSASVWANTALLFTALFAVVLAVQLRLRPLRPGGLLAHRRRAQRHRHAVHRHPHRPASACPSGSAPPCSPCCSPLSSGSGTPASARCRSTASSRTPREGFYWLAVLVTFALGTAAGDWTLDLTGWGPGTSVLLPLGLIAWWSRLAARRGRSCPSGWPTSSPGPSARTSATGSPSHGEQGLGLGTAARPSCSCSPSWPRSST